MAGDSEKEAGIRLGLRPHSVHSYVKQLHEAFDVTSRGELLSLFVSPPGPRVVQYANGRVLASPDPFGNLVANNADTGEERSLVPPAAGAPKTEHVAFCVNLLRRRGYLVSLAEAAEQLLGRRRGLATFSAALTAVVFAAFAHLTLDDPPWRQPDTYAANGAAASPLTSNQSSEPNVINQYPKNLEVLPPVSGEWQPLARVHLWETVSWSALSGSAELRVGVREIEPGIPYAVDMPGMVYVRASNPANAEMAVVRLTIEQARRDQQPATLRRRSA